MSARKYTFRILSAAIALAALVAAAPAKAAPPLLVTASKFSLTFPDGWTALPFSSDTIKFVMNQATEAACYMMAIPQAGEMTAQQMADYMAMYGASDSIVETGRGTKTLGGKSFSYVEFKDVDGEDENARVRFYYTQTGSLLFHASVIFDLPVAETVITQAEAALATLSLTGNSSLRAAALRGPAARAATHDVLGRNSDALRQARLFRVPAL